MIDILHRYTKAILFHSEAAQTIAEAVVGAVENGASLHGASLDGASLRGAFLDGVREYRHSHDIFAEAVRRQFIETFTVAEWAAIGKIIVHRPCWDTIYARYADVAAHVLDVLAEAGFTEWRELWIKLTEERPANVV